MNQHAFFGVTEFLTVLLTITTLLSPPAFVYFSPGWATTESPTMTHGCRMRAMNVIPLFVRSLISLFHVVVVAPSEMKRKGISLERKLRGYRWLSQPGFGNDSSRDSVVGNTFAQRVSIMSRPIIELCHVRYIFFHSP